MQSNGETNGHGNMNLQFVNETEAVISESLGNDYGDFGIKRGVESDTDSEDSKRLGYSAGGDSPVALKTGKKTKGRVKIKMEFIENKLRRYTTFSKRKTGIMKKAYELSTLTGTQVMLLVASETGHVYTFATKKLQPMITSESGKALIQTCLNSPDGVMVSPTHAGGSDQRMNPTGFEETELSCGIPDDEQGSSPNKDEESKQNLFYTPDVSSQPVSSSLITSSTTPIIITPQSNMSTVTTGQQSQQPSVQLQPPPAHMGIQSAPTHTQPPQAHTGPVSSVTVSNTATTARTVTMMSYTPSQQVDNTQSNGSTKSTVPVQLPTGGFTIVPASLGQLPAGTQNIGATSPAPSTSQRQQLPQLQQPVAVVSGNTSGTSSSSTGPVVYQTPQGLLYAAPSNVGSLPEGYVINLAASQGLSLPPQDGQQQPGGSTQQYITIPVPVSLAAGSGTVLQPVLTQAASGDANRMDKAPK
ncbi:hypothetical protein LSH36_484g02024 [Paralvinella palmiformis]|uniref:MADS-box domain-containing protein n=1 Tax=Paralvinella palmiformis TaxID=53620 RepID=A0AAD9MWV9_9ANNE|nr:hypothetical protein LSH36_484g02024 [Paralvinella palmiformis]